MGDVGVFDKFSSSKTMTTIILPACAFEPELPDFLERLGEGAAAYVFYRLPPEESNPVKGSGEK
jgi:hypothetical protein